MDTIKEMDTNTKVNLVKKLPSNFKMNALLIGVAFLVVIGGIGTGYLLSNVGKKTDSSDSMKAATGDKQVSDNNSAGVEDESAFPDNAQGVLTEGGIDGEGTHHLDRGLGPTKHVYLTSTVIDLESFVGKKVEVWGQTVTAQKAGWLMDVGKIKVLDN